MASEFDDYASNYTQLVNDSLKATGYDATHFVERKLDRLRSINAPIRDAPFNFLDYGCGSGNLFSRFAEFFPKARYVGVDASQEMIRECRTKYAASFYELRDSAWKAERYQVIFAAGVFHHIPHAQHAAIAQELIGLLARPGGKMIVWEHNPLNPFTRKVVRDCAFDRDAVLVPPSTMQQMFSRFPPLRVQLAYTTFFPKALAFLNPLEHYFEWLPLGGQYVVIAETA
jgi:trans-aconitate methyltransferase